jgi:hypothetical protein
MKISSIQRAKEVAERFGKVAELLPSYPPEKADRLLRKKWYREALRGASRDLSQALSDMRRR